MIVHGTALQDDDSTRDSIDSNLTSCPPETPERQMTHFQVTILALGFLAICSMPMGAQAQGTETLWVNGDPVTITDLGDGIQYVRMNGQYYRVMQVGQMVQIQSQRARHHQQGATGFGGSAALSLLQGLLKGHAEAQKRQRLSETTETVVQVLRQNPNLPPAVRWCLEVAPYAELEPEFAQAWTLSCKPMLENLGKR